MSGMGLVIASVRHTSPCGSEEENYSKFEHFYDQFCIFMQLFLFGMTSITLVENFRPGTVNIPLVITIAIGILFLFIGNELPKVKSNFFDGHTDSMVFRSEGELAQNSPSGRKMLLHGRYHPDPGAFLPSQKLVFGIMFAMIMVASLVPTLMSYLWYRKGI